jgi:hypothetical protein
MAAIYRGHFRTVKAAVSGALSGADAETVSPCERLLDNDAVVVYTRHQSLLPPLTAGVTILHTFDPAIRPVPG